jgi:hypothetical protein
MTGQHDASRYLDITAAHRALAALGTGAERVAALAKSKPFDDGGDYNRPLYDALAIHLDAAAAAVCGELPSVVPTVVDADYAAALAERLDELAEAATTVAKHATAARLALDGGLITDPRPWSADDINTGAMLDTLDTDDDDDDGWYAFDAMHLEGCVHALNVERLTGTIDADTYDRHMTRIAAVSGAVGPHPAGSAEHVEKALTQWRAEESEAVAVLAAPDYEGLAPMRARQAINGARTYARLAAYATALAAPAWDTDRRRADHNMALVYRTAHKMGTDTHGYGPKSDRADALFDTLNEWRTGAYAARMATASAFDITDMDNSEEVAAAVETLYLALYDAVEFAVSTGQLLDVWRSATALPDHRRNVIHARVLIHFEESRTGTGCHLVDGGPFAEHTKALRELVDAYPLGTNSNITHAVLYRGFRDAIERIDMGDFDAATDTQLVRAWADAADAIMRADITRRQARVLRDLVNAKVAQWCDGDEHRADALMFRLAYWGRITEELQA